MKNLLVFHPALAPYRIDFFNALADSFDTDFYFSNDNVKDQKFDQQQLRAQCRFEFRLLNNGLEFGGRSIRTGILKLLRIHKPDIVICSEYSQITLMVMVMKSVFKFDFKLYIISDDSIDLSAKRSGPRKWIRDKVSNYIDGIIFPGDLVCSWYHQNVNTHTRLCSLPIVHENNAFRLKLNRVLAAASIERGKFGLESKRIFLFAGRLIKIKNASFLIKAFYSGLSMMPDAVLVIVGEGPENDKLRKLASDLDMDANCIFLGRLEGDALYAWYQIAHCLVLPSYLEPYGVVVNEALLAGCQVLCSRLAGAAELITPDNGAVFDPFNLEDLADLLVAQYHTIAVNEIELEEKTDLMPFQLTHKLTSLISFLKNE